jgi:nucleotide-binding universal stress UspA family protein
MKLAVCFDGIDDEALTMAAVPFVRGYDAVESWCGYGDEAQRLVEHVAQRHHGPPHPPPMHHHHSALDEEQARAIAQHGVALLKRENVAATARTLGGDNAEHAIAAATEPGVLLLIAAGHRGGIGPRSVGHVARFVIDHARGPVLVVRL